MGEHTDLYDVIFVGGGHNALVAAAYLTGAGRSVLVLDNNDRPGGFVRTDEIIPGFRGDTFSAAHTLLFAGPVYRDLGAKLESVGLRYVDPVHPSGVSMEDGTTAVMPRTMEEFVAEADRLVPGDGATFRELIEELAPSVGDVFALFSEDLTSAEAKQIRDRLLTGSGGVGFSSFAASLVESARDVVDRFASATLRSMLGSWATHFGKGPDDAGGGIWVKLFVLASMQGGQPVPEGGSGRLAEALARLVADQGGTVRTGEHVTQIVVEAGRAVGVRTEHGEFVRAVDAVIASVTPDQLYLRLLSNADVPTDLIRQASRYRYGRGQLQLNLALSRPPRWPDERFDRVGQPFLTDSLDGLALHVAHTKASLLPSKPTFSVQVPTAVDPTRAPAGRAVMRVQVTDVPTRPRGDAAGIIEVGDVGWTQDLTSRFVERVLNTLERHAPGITGSILGHTVVTPSDLASFNLNAGPGDAYAGAQDLAQSYLFRPLAGQPSHRTAVPNVYMIGAGTWPGGGVSGSSGYIVARQLLADGVTS
ncbi:phytoene desaturase family protein [Mycolicibacterium baixiangningiae]|uniref:phytoene desaturase family protein n=1 Tax=Mycolicibacterium baixiangningiae TaxID=2761578 RepID=UPI0018671468|nr:NAD(P)/FAD-dependent oxidoreductase [Mycolicibacterium baixiangningiae]